MTTETTHRPIEQIEADLQNAIADNGDPKLYALWLEKQSAEIHALEQKNEQFESRIKRKDAVLFGAIAGAIMGKAIESLIESDPA